MPDRATHPAHVRVVVEDLEDIISRAHDACGHMYYYKTYLNIKLSYTHVTRDAVKAFCARCAVCATYRSDPNKKRRWRYRPIHASGPMRHFTIDYIDYRHNQGWGPCVLLGVTWYMSLDQI